MSRYAWKRPANMLITPNRGNLNKIVVLNPKGGCGKTTLVTNLASIYAQRGPMPAVMDCDPQGSSMRWIEKRSGDCAPVHGIAAYKKNMQATRSWQLRVPNETRTLIVDSPAGLNHDDLRELSRDATSILVPVLPSSIDIHAASRCIADLLLVAKIDRRDRKLAVIANRTRQNTRSFEKLMRFLDSLEIPIVGVLRDSQNFLHAVDHGIGICEMPPHRARREIEQFDRIVAWLEDWPRRRRCTAVSQRVPRPPTLTVLRNAGSGPV